MLPLSAAARGISGFLGVYLVSNVALGAVRPGADLSHWLVDVRGAPDAVRATLLVGAGLPMAMWGWTGRLTRTAAAALASVAALATVDAVQVARLESVAVSPVSFSSLLALLLTGAAIVALREQTCR
jgi:hypothetical protein